MTGQPTHLLDTNIIAALARGRSPAAVRRLREVGADRVAVSVIVACEIRFGLLKAGSEALRNQVERVLAEIPVLPLEPQAAEHYGEIRQELESAGTPIGPNDLLIAAHARVAGLTLVTDNTREFRRVPGLNLENWLEEAA